jgi:hypothetical protein
MNLEALVLGLFSGLRPGTSLAAVLALLKAPRPKRLLLFFTAAGFASSWAIGLVVVGVFHGADVAVGGSTFAAVLDVTLGAAALGFAAGLQQGWVQPRRRRSSNRSATAAFLAVRPAPAQPLSRRRRRRRCRHTSARAHLPGNTQRDRLRTACTRGRRPAGRDLRCPLVPDPHRVAHAGDGASQCGRRVSRRGDGMGPSSRARHRRVGLIRSQRLPRRQGDGEPAHLKPPLTGSVCVRGRALVGVCSRGVRQRGSSLHPTRQFPRTRRRRRHPRRPVGGVLTVPPELRRFLATWHHHRRPLALDRTAPLFPGETRGRLRPATIQRRLAQLDAPASLWHDAARHHHRRRYERRRPRSPA